MSISSVYMFSITFTHLTELLALGGRRSEALPFVRVNVRQTCGCRSFAP